MSMPFFKKMFMKKKNKSEQANTVNYEPAVVNYDEKSHTFDVIKSSGDKKNKMMKFLKEKNQCDRVSKFILSPTGKEDILYFPHDMKSIRYLELVMK